VRDKSGYIPWPVFADYPLGHNEQYSTRGRLFFQQDLIPSPESSNLGSKGLSESLGRVHFSRSVLDLLGVRATSRGIREELPPLAVLLDYDELRKFAEKLAEAR